MRCLESEKVVCTDVYIYIHICVYRYIYIYMYGTCTYACPYRNLVPQALGKEQESMCFD